MKRIEKIIKKLLVLQKFYFPFYKNDIEELGGIEEAIRAWSIALKDCKEDHILIATDELFKSAKKALLPVDIIQYCRNLQGRENSRYDQNKIVWDKEFLKDIVDENKKGRGE